MAKEMLFSVVCPTCEVKIGVHDKRLVGQLVQCPKCGSIVQLSPPETGLKDVDSPQTPVAEQKTPAAEQKTVIPPPIASPIAPVKQPLSENKDKIEKTPQNSPPPPVHKAPPVPVPPPAAIPVPPPISIPEPIAPDSLMPEPMSPEGVKSASSVGIRSFSQRVAALSEKLPSWTPYVVIGIGVLALCTLMTSIFFFAGSKNEENGDNQEVVENKELKSDSENNKNSVSDLLENTGKSETEKEAENKECVLIDENAQKDIIEKDFGLIEDEDDGENAPEENGDAGNSALSDDNIENDKTENPENNPVENAEIIKDEKGSVTDSQPEENIEDENPFQEVEPDALDQESEAKEPAEDNPVPNEDNVVPNGDDILGAIDGLRPENISNNVSNTDDNSEKDSKSESEISSLPGLNVKLKSISMKDLKLSQCLQTIRELGALPVEVNWDFLRRNGVSADDKISWSGKDVTVKTALTEVLAQRGLMFKVNEDSKIVFVPRVSVNARSGSSVNSAQQDGSVMVKEQYSVSDLVGQSPEKTAALIKSIREFLCPGDWKEVGGAGTIASSGGGSVMITQSQQNQWIIADFLDRLRLARRLAPLYNRDASLEPMSVRSQSALKRNVGINFQPSVGLKTALSRIGQRINVNILLDEPSLKIAGISAQFPVSFDAQEMSLEEVFNRINSETNLTYLAQTPNSFIVTTPEGAKSMMSVEFYPIADLVSIGLTPTVLIDQIVKMMEPKSWKTQDSASFGLIEYDENSDCLIVRQSPSVLSKINELLTQLRARLKEKE